MKFLTTRKISLEIRKVRLKTESLSLEVEKLKREKQREENAEKANAVAQRILDHVRSKKSNDPTGGNRSMVLNKQDISEALNESPEEIEGDLLILKGQQRTRYDAF